MSLVVTSWLDTLNHLTHLPLRLSTFNVSSSFWNPSFPVFFFVFNHSLLRFSLPLERPRKGSYAWDMVSVRIFFYYKKKQFKGKNKWKKGPLSRIQRIENGLNGSVKFRERCHDEDTKRKKKKRSNRLCNADAYYMLAFSSVMEACWERHAHRSLSPLVQK